MATKKHIPAQAFSFTFSSTTVLIDEVGYWLSKTGEHSVVFSTKEK